MERARAQDNIGLGVRKHGPSTLDLRHTIAESLTDQSERLLAREAPTGSGDDPGSSEPSPTLQIFSNSRLRCNACNVECATTKTCRHTQCFRLGGSGFNVLDSEGGNFKLFGLIY